VTSLRAAETCWPLAGTAGYAKVPPGWREDLAAWLRAMLDHDVVAPWFPRTLDRQRGGFRSDFDGRWRASGPEERMLEFQARQTRTVARLGQAIPDERDWRDYTEHGRRYLGDVMRDSADGGWFWLLDPADQPLANGTKHAHSTAYVIGAYVEAYRLTGDVTALEAAQAAFEWLDAALHDNEHGGYHGWATREGRPILTRAEAGDWPRDDEPLGHRIGLKDANVHTDLLESLRLLYIERPSPAVAARLSELYEIIDRHFMADDGVMHYLLNRDLSPVATAAHPGYAFQCTERLPAAAPLIGRSANEALATGRRAVDRALRTGWDSRRDGLLEKLDPPSERRRAWWVQTEAMLALVLLEVNLGEGTYRGWLDQLRALVEREFLDHRLGGWHETPVSDWSIRERLLPRRRPKAHRWKDASHETDMALSAIRMLRGLDAHEPIAKAAPGSA
jgi:mannobiose 2-epimerase